MPFDPLDYQPPPPPPEPLPRRLTPRSEACCFPSLLAASQISSRICGVETDSPNAHASTPQVVSGNVRVFLGIPRISY